MTTVIIAFDPETMLRFGRNYHVTLTYEAVADYSRLWTCACSTGEALLRRNRGKQ